MTCYEMGSVLSKEDMDQAFLVLIVKARYLLEKDFPGMRIGPEPTTDNFHIIRY